MANLNSGGYGTQANLIAFLDDGLSYREADRYEAIESNSNGSLTWLVGQYNRAFGYIFLPGILTVENGIVENGVLTSGDVMLLKGVGYTTLSSDMPLFTVQDARDAAAGVISHHEFLAQVFSGDDNIFFVSYDRYPAGVSFSGYGGDDRIRTGDYDDRLFGGSGNDRLLGRGGDDVLHGGSGNDRLFGDVGNDILTGGTGADTMLGGSGDDTYFVDDVMDRVFDGDNAGDDTVVSSADFAIGYREYIEFLRAAEGAGSLVLQGNTLVNTIVGGDGNDTIIGGLGGDTLTGGAGADTFRYASAESMDGFDSRDRILDFDVGIDRIDLSAVYAKYPTDRGDPFSYIGSSSFTGTAGELRTIQTKGSTIVEGDIDGDGHADLQIVLKGVTEGISALDFVL